MVDLYGINVGNYIYYIPYMDASWDIANPVSHVQVFFLCHVLQMKLMTIVEKTQSAAIVSPFCQILVPLIRNITKGGGNVSTHHW